MTRDIHFHKHGRTLGIADAEEYERTADGFMSGVIERHTQQCQRPNRGDRLRFNTFDRRFGAEASQEPRFLRTFYKVEQGHINYHGGEQAYFGWECGRIDL
jgi:hypothetical protein